MFVLILVSIIIFIIVLTLIILSTQSNNILPKCVYPEALSNDLNMRRWKWEPKCKSKVNFMINSEWPTFLTYKAWDSCQGCKSATATGDSSGDSFQVIGDWMRIAQRTGKDASVVSGASSKEHWYNPPRNNTNDKPLEIEWYMYLDASKWGRTQQEIIASGLTDRNWSAFWSFGHGTGEFAWPIGGEWDIAEWLPSFGGARAGKGLASGFHNTNTGAYPACCLKQDGIMFSKTGNIGGSVAEDGSGFVWNDSGEPSFRNWGYLLNKTKNPKWDKDWYDSDAITYNRVIHCFLRCTTKDVAIWAKVDADPKNPPNIRTRPSMSNLDVNKLFTRKGYTTVFTSYGDFGSNNDTTFAKAFPDRAGNAGTGSNGIANKGTNWHQNMFFVWTTILKSVRAGAVHHDSDPEALHRPLSFYMSDIHIRGGGNYTKAMAPPGIINPTLIRQATQTSDPTAYLKCKEWLGDGSSSRNVCDNRLIKNASNQYKKCKSR